MTAQAKLGEPEIQARATASRIQNAARMRFARYAETAHPQRLIEAAVHLQRIANNIGIAKRLTTMVPHYPEGQESMRAEIRGLLHQAEMSSQDLRDLIES